MRVFKVLGDDSMFDRTVYKCPLYSVTPDIIVYNDWSIKDNINYEEIEQVGTIMVQPTFRRGVYKEVITGMKFPVYIMYSYPPWWLECQRYPEVRPGSPAFVLMHVQVRKPDPSPTDWEKANADDLEKYLEQDPNNFKNQLENIKQKAYEYYDNASLKNYYSNKARVKSLVKSFKRR